MQPQTDNFKLSIIVAMDNKRTIGANNTLLWHLPTDLKHFKTLTSGHPIIMGRKTFESLPGILPNRPHIIISRNLKYQIQNAVVCQGLDIAIKHAKTYQTGQAFIIGGGEIYNLSINIADCLEITEVDATYTGDTFFPEIDTNIWQEVSRKSYHADNKNRHDFNFVTYNKKN